MTIYEKVYGYFETTLTEGGKSVQSKAKELFDDFMRLELSGNQSQEVVLEIIREALSRLFATLVLDRSC